MSYRTNAERHLSVAPRLNDDGPPGAPLTVESCDNHLYFYSEITSDRTLALLKAARDISNRLIAERFSRELPEDYPHTPIWLHIESPGGSLFSAFAAAEQLKKLPSPVFSVIEGYAASGATIISAACTKRYILGSAYMMIHQLSSGFWGKFSEMEDELGVCHKAMEQLVTFYREHSRMNAKQIRQKLSRDSWLTAEEALKLGLVDAVR